MARVNVRSGSLAKRAMFVHMACMAKTVRNHVVGMRLVLATGDALRTAPASAKGDSQASIAHFAI